jgi:hypothetical protein
MWAMPTRTAPSPTSTPTWATSMPPQRAPCPQIQKSLELHTTRMSMLERMHCMHLPLASTRLSFCSFPGPCRYYDRYIESMNTDGPV